MTSTYPRGTLGSVAFLLAVTLYQGTTSYALSDQLRDAYSICRCCWILVEFVLLNLFEKLISIIFIKLRKGYFPEVRRTEGE